MAFSGNDALIAPYLFVCLFVYYFGFLFVSLFWGFFVFLVFFILLFLQDWVSLSISACSRTDYIDEVGLELRDPALPLFPKFWDKRHVPTPLDFPLIFIL